MKKWLVQLATFLITYATQLKFQVLFEVTMHMPVWSYAVGETLNNKPDNKGEAKDYDKFAIGVYKGDLLVGHVPIEISRLYYYSLNNNEENIFTAIVTGKRNREVGLVVPVKLFFQTKDRKLL